MVRLESDEMGMAVYMSWADLLFYVVMHAGLLALLFGYIGWLRWYA